MIQYKFVLTAYHHFELSCILPNLIPSLVGLKGKLGCTTVHYIQCTTVHHGALLGCHQIRSTLDLVQPGHLQFSNLVLLWYSFLLSYYLVSHTIPLSYTITSLIPSHPVPNNDARQTPCALELPCLLTLLYFFSSSLSQHPFFRCASISWFQVVSGWVSQWLIFFGFKASASVGRLSIYLTLP